MPRKKEAKGREIAIAIYLVPSAGSSLFRFYGLGRAHLSLRTEFAISAIQPRRPDKNAANILMAAAVRNQNLAGFC